MTGAQIEPAPDLTGVELPGMFLGSFGRACVNLGLIADADLGALAALAPDAWCPAEIFTGFLAGLAPRFSNFDPIKERIGTEMMRLWYEFGPGRAIVHSGVDFLHHQVGSQGYHSLMRGPPERVGGFVLDHLDVARGRAQVTSSSPFDRSMERGILIGGMQLAGDLVYVDVDNRANPSVFAIEFR